MDELEAIRARWTSSGRMAPVDVPSECDHDDAPLVAPVEGCPHCKGTGALDPGLPCCCACSACHIEFGAEPGPFGTLHDAVRDVHYLLDLLARSKS